MRRLSTEQRFWLSVSPEPNTGCFLWLGSLCQGYGCFGRGRAHRFAWVMANGPVPPGLMVRHFVCGNRSCVNVEHLRLGTHQDNMDDRARDGRTAFGDRNASRLYPERRPKRENHWKAKLSPAQVEEIRASKARQVDLAEKYGITQGHVSALRRGASWANV